MRKFEVQSSTFEVRMVAKARRLAAVGLMCGVALGTLVAQQRDANKPPAAVAVTGEISGVVLSPDGQPVKRAVVTLSGGVPIPRTVLSDDAGKIGRASCRERVCYVV